MTLEPTEYQLDLVRDPDTGQVLIDVRLQRRIQRDGTFRWIIRENSAVLTKHGEWIFDGKPCTDWPGFMEDTRFGTADEAYDFWTDGGHKSAYDYYRVALAQKRPRSGAQVHTTLGDSVKLEVSR